MSQRLHDFVQELRCLPRQDAESATHDAEPDQAHLRIAEVVHRHRSDDARLRVLLAQVHPMARQSVRIILIRELGASRATALCASVYGAGQTDFTPVLSLAWISTEGG